MKTKYEKIIDKIEKIRGKNNSNWMDILRLAFRYNPKRAAEIMTKIYADDVKIGKIAKQLIK
jgi:hypothetical protein